MSSEQQQAAQAAQLAAGVGRGDGLPPAGAAAVFWVLRSDGTWSWASAIWPYAVDQGGVVIGQPPPAPANETASTRKAGR
jgi:hypothetical protein